MSFVSSDAGLKGEFCFLRPDERKLIQAVLNTHSGRPSQLKGFFPSSVLKKLTGLNEFS